VIVFAAGAGVEFGEWEAEVATASMRVTGNPRLLPERGPRQRSVDLAEAEDFLRLFHAETDGGTAGLSERLDGVRAEIAATGTYRHTTAEVEFGARVAWRNSARCIGRLYWQGLRVRGHRRDHLSPAPFNGWYLATEIGARDLADTDRYDLLPVIADLMGLSTKSERTLWRDRALVELTPAVQHSFDAAGVTVADHHTESRRFLTHSAKEEQAGRRCQADWSWIVPPLPGGQTAVFHRYYDEPDPAARPAFLPPGRRSDG